MAKKQTNEVIKLEEFSARIKWHISDNIITRFVTNMTVQGTQSEFIISFFEVRPPIILDSSEERPKEVLAECVASVVVTPDRLPKFIEALQKQFDAYQQRDKPTQ